MTGDEHQISGRIRSFYSAFDNRSGRIPVDHEIRRMFVAEATITHLVVGRPKVLTLDAFLAPRLKLLTDGSLCDFHEWETIQSTDVRFNLASRISTYQKQGMLNG